MSAPLSLRSELDEAQGKGQANDNCFSDAVLQFPLQRRWHAIAFVALLVLPGFWLILVTMRIATAATLAKSSKVTDLRKAMQLDPDNPEPYHRLGLLYSYSLEEINPAAALQHLRRATALEPHQARLWLDFATVCEGAGDNACADVAMQRALELWPMNPQIWWAAGNYYLRAERTDAAWRHFRRLLEISPGHAPAAFQLCLRATGDPQLVYERVLPPRGYPNLSLQYVNFLSARGEHELAFQVWTKTVSGLAPRALSFSATRGYLDRLLSLGRYEEAVSVWKDLLRLEAVSRAAVPDRANLVFNGDFEQPPLNAGFDWRPLRLPYVSVDFQSPSAYRGAKCLRVDFTVKHNEEYDVVSQLVPLAPSQRYLLRAYVRSENITSESGPRLRIRDPANRTRLDVSTPAVVGTTSWHPVELTFSTGPKTQVVRLSVWRARSRVFPTEISGRFWMDGVSVTPLGPVLEHATLGLNPAP
jgi:tetratricopeptide (TPR) repeat protein